LDAALTLLQVYLVDLGIQCADVSPDAFKLRCKEKLRSTSLISSIILFSIVFGAKGQAYSGTGMTGV